MRCVNVCRQDSNEKQGKRDAGRALEARNEQADGPEDLQDAGDDDGETRVRHPGRNHPNKRLFHGREMGAAGKKQHHRQGIAGTNLPGTKGRNAKGTQTPEPKQSSSQNNQNNGHRLCGRNGDLDGGVRLEIQRQSKFPAGQFEPIPCRFLEALPVMAVVGINPSDFAVSPA